MQNLGYIYLRWCPHWAADSRHLSVFYLELWPDGQALGWPDRRVRTQVALTLLGEATGRRGVMDGTHRLWICLVYKRRMAPQTPPFVRTKRQKNLRPDMSESERSKNQSKIEHHSVRDLSLVQDGWPLWGGRPVQIYQQGQIILLNVILMCLPLVFYLVWGVLNSLMIEHQCGPPILQLSPNVSSRMRRCNGCRPFCYDRRVCYTIDQTRYNSGLFFFSAATGSRWCYQPTFETTSPSAVWFGDLRLARAVYRMQQQMNRRPNSFLFQIYCLCTWTRNRLSDFSVRSLFFFFLASETPNYSSSLQRRWNTTEAVCFFPTGNISPYIPKVIWFDTETRAVSLWSTNLAANNLKHVETKK